MLENKPLDVDEELKDLEAKRAAGNALLDLMISVLPEEARLDYEILKAHSQLMDASQKAVIFFSKDSPNSPTSEFVEAQKAVRDFLTDVASDITTYLDSVKENLKPEHENQ